MSELTKIIEVVVRMDNGVEYVIQSSGFEGSLDFQVDDISDSVGLKGAGGIRTVAIDLRGSYQSAKRRRLRAADRRRLLPEIEKTAAQVRVT